MTPTHELPTRDTDELTIEEAAIRAGVPLDHLTKLVRRNKIPSRLVRGPRQGARVLRVSVLDEFGFGPKAAAAVRPVLELAGLRVEPVRSALDDHEVAFLLQVPVEHLRDLAARGGLEYVKERGRMRFPISAVGRLGGIHDNPLALVYLARLAEGILRLPRPDEADQALDHIAALRLLGEVS